MAIEPFVISIPEREIVDLRSRLARTRWPDQVADIGWLQGTDRDVLMEFVSYWRTGFDWRKQEAALNDFGQFSMAIDGQSIHFIYERAKAGPGIPLLITHGWPGSFAEMLNLIPMLTDPERFGASREDAFDVVVPSLPGYAFSAPPTRVGMDTFEIARLWVALMSELGYDRFAAQGGDWGAYVTTCLGWLFPERLIALHLNRIPGGLKPPHDASGKDLSPAEKLFLLNYHGSWAETEGAYAHVQSTKPQSLAYALNDSPVGLAAWMLEKFWTWSDRDGDIEQAFSKDDILTNISIYWFTQTIASSMRLYWESARRALSFAPGERINVPCAVAVFPKEIVMPPRSWAERVYDIRRWTRMDRGGHFAALEQPTLLANDLREFFRPFRKAHC